MWIARCVAQSGKCTQSWSHHISVITSNLYLTAGSAVCYPAAEVTNATELVHSYVCIVETIYRHLVSGSQMPPLQQCLVHTAL